MADIRIPQASMEMTEGTLHSWLVADGAQVAEGEMIYELETEKVTMEVEAGSAGVLRRVGEEGETYQVGDVIGHIE